MPPAFTFAWSIRVSPSTAAAGMLASRTAHEPIVVRNAFIGLLITPSFTGSRACRLTDIGMELRSRSPDLCAAAVIAEQDVVAVAGLGAGSVGRQSVASVA